MFMQETLQNCIMHLPQSQCAMHSQMSCWQEVR